MTTIEITLSVLDSLYDAAKAKGAWNCKVSLTSFREEFVKWVQGFDAGDEIVKRAENQAQVLFKKIQRHRGLHTRDKAAVDKNEIILSLSLPGNNAAPLASQSELCQQDKRRRSKQPIDELSSKRHRYRRLEPLIEQIKATAEEENTEIPHLLGLILHKLYYHSDRRVANIASQLIDISNENISKVAVPVASHIKSYCNLGREGYQRLTRSLKTSDLDVLPSWKTVRAYERTLTPEVKELEDKMGVEFDYKEALGKSAEQIIKQLDPKPTDTKLTLTVKDGLDGSGSHSIFNQDDEELKQKTSSARRRLYLVRHGQYELEKQNDKDKILTELGRQQAECTGKHLARLGVKYSDLVVSTMTRANETGEIILKQLHDSDVKVLGESFEVDKTDMLREGHPIDCVPYHRFKPDSWEFQDGARIEAAFRKYFHRAHYSQKEDSHEIIVCHANVIRYLVCRATQNPPEGWLRMSLANGSITEVTMEPNGKVFISGIGDKGHMPSNMITFT
ncbi:hypothetical protein ACHWQZ_G018154 [Mnemiopsis leidyi]